ncbi:MAG: hypothetical protein JOY62_13775 [Acidobacteriaceae bacterium]|nr:hypothetical protein [Acidobacteriaceae bacterium]MBV9781031.1 hypothetical protein [Acidobacteriaceae bacterium]
MKSGRILLASVLFVGACFAQTEKPSSQEEHFYRLDYVVKEVDGARVVNSRNYSTMISTGHVSEIRTGSKVPVSSDNKVEYMDIGVNVDSRRPRELENQLALEISAEISSVASGEARSGEPPRVRQNRWQADVLLPLRRPVVVFSSDDPGSTHKMQLEVTATQIK